MPKTKIQAIILAEQPLMNKHKTEVHKYFNTLSEEELFDFYIYIKENGNDIAVAWAFAENPNTTGKIIEDFFSERDILQMPWSSVTRMAEHPNCPDKVKLQLYVATGNSKYIYGPARSFFVFPK